MTYAEFWHEYLRAHAKPSTRLMHYGGSVLALLCLVAAIALLNWRFLILAMFIGYGAAWVSHVGLEGNTPKTFGHPFWSLFSDFRMLGLWLSGRLAPHLEAANKEGSGTPGAFALSGGTGPET